MLGTLPEIGVHCGFGVLSILFLKLGGICGVLSILFLKLGDSGSLQLSRRAGSPSLEMEVLETPLWVL